MPDKPSRSTRTFLNYLGVSARGFCMGVADIVPGVSGGTMAFILGVYEELLEAIHAVNGKFLKLLFTFQINKALDGFPYRFLLALVSGIILAIFSLASFFSWALSQHPVLVWAFFFGLVLASIITIRVKVSDWTTTEVFALVLAAIIAFLVVSIVPLETTSAPWFVFMSGAIAICAMILPGISGSFMLVLLGKYEFMLNSVVQYNFFPITIFASGGILGLVLFSRGLRWMLINYQNPTVAFLIGLMVGSLRKIWPWKTTVETYTDRHGIVKPLIQENILPVSFSGETLLAIGLGIFGCALVLIIERFVTNK